MSVKRIGKYKFKENLTEYESFKRRIPNVVGNLAVNHFQLGFRKRGKQTDSSLSGWKKREKEDKGRAILVKTGRLRRNIKRLSARFNRIVVGTHGVDYAKVHNEGLRIDVIQNVKSHRRKVKRKRKKILIKQHSRRLNFKMPKREFIGDSKKMNKKILNKINRELRKALR